MSWAALAPRGDVVAAILAMAAATLLCRAGGYALLRALPPPRFVRAMLRHLPGALFVAYVVPSLTAGGSAAWIAGAATAATMAATRNLMAAILAGVAAMAALRWLGA